MRQYNFIDAGDSIFEMNSRPQLAYIQITGNNDDEKQVIPKALHSHQNITEIMFISDGTFDYIIDGKVTHIEDTSMILLNTGVLHGSITSCSPDVRITTLGIKNLHLVGLPAGIIVDKGIEPVISYAEQQENIYLYLKLLYNMIEVEKKESIAEASNAVLTAIIATIRNQVVAAGASKAMTQEYNLGIRIKEYIDEHYLEDLKLPDIADALHINHYYMSHTFKKILGYSPMQYVIHRRIGEAQNMLINTNMTITDIAMHCGYNNSNYFQVVFNTIVGMPPGKYRKSWRK